MLSNTLDTEDEVIASPAQLDLVLEFVVPQALSADRVPQRVFDDRTHLSVRLLLETNNTSREAPLEFARVGAPDGFNDVDCWQKTVRGSRDGREFGVITPDALYGVGDNVDGLVRTKFGEENVGVDWRDGALARKVLGLSTSRLEFELMSVDWTTRC